MCGKLQEAKWLCGKPEETAGPTLRRAAKSRTPQEGTKRALRVGGESWKPRVAHCEELHSVDEESVFAFHLDNQVNGKLTMDGVNSAHLAGVFVYTDLVSISQWHVMLDGLEFNVAAVKTVPVGREVYDCWLSLSTTIVKGFGNLLTIGFVVPAHGACAK